MFAIAFVQYLQYFIVLAVYQQILIKGVFLFSPTYVNIRGVKAAGRLNDILTIVTIAYDTVKYSDKPEKWDMTTLLGISTMLGIMGVLETFGLLYLGLELLKLNHEVLQSFIYLKLSVAGHFLLLMARTKGPFWSVKPAKPLFVAVIGTQLIATLITVYGILLPAMGWRLAFFVLGYCLIGLLTIDFIKVHLYKLLDHTGIRFHRWGFIIPFTKIT